MPQTLQSWPIVVYLVDPTVLAGVAWVALIVTIAGFAIAIIQIRKVRTASESATRAVRQIVGIIKERASLADLSSAVANVESIRNYIASSDYERAIIYIDLLRSQLISIRETISADNESVRQIPRFLVELNVMAEQLLSASRQSRELDVVSLIPLLVPVADMLKRHVARLRYAARDIDIESE